MQLFLLENHILAFNASFFLNKIKQYIADITHKQPRLEPRYIMSPQKKQNFRARGEFVQG